MKKQSDVNDLGKAGVGTSTLTNAALGQGLIVISSMAQARTVGEDALRRLGEYADKIEAAQSKDDAVLIWAKVCADEALEAGMSAACYANMGQRLYAIMLRVGNRVGRQLVNEVYRNAKIGAVKMGGDREDRLGVAANDENDAEAATILRKMNAPRGLVVPKGYILTEDGVSFQGDEVANEPVIIRATYFDYDTGIEYAEYTYLENGTVRSKITRMTGLLSARELVAQADSGLLVSSENAGKVTTYFRHLIAQNRRVLGRKPISTRTGWVRMGTSWRFMLPNKVVTTEGAFEIMTPDDGAMPAVSVDGDWSTWAREMEWVSNFPYAYITLYVALAPTLLMPLKIEGLVYENFGMTSTGKTTAMKIAASVWGKPTIGAGGFLRSWNSTHNAIVGSMVGGCDLPSIFDDAEALTKIQKSMLEPVIYAVTQGGKMRATKDGGLRQAGTIRTVLATGGEASILSYGSKKAGAEARTISNPKTPFGRVTEDSKVRVPRLNQVLEMNYGHLGERWLCCLTKNQGRWSEYRDRLRVLMDLTGEELRSSDDGRMTRKAKSIALLKLVAELLHEEYGLLPWPKTNIVEQMVGVVIAGKSNADVAISALLDVYSWANARANQFLRGGAYNKDAPYSGWLGRWDLPSELSTTNEIPNIYIYPQVMKKALTDLEYEPEVIIGMWSSMGFFDCARGRQKTCRLNGQSVSVYVLLGQAISAGLEGRKHVPADAMLNPEVPQTTPVPF